MADTEYTDLVGRPLAEGDHVAYPTQAGSSSRMCVARIVRIDPLEGQTYDWQARKHSTRLSWTVRLQPIEWTDYRATSRWGYRDGKYQKLEENIAPKQVTVYKVENLVKVDIESGS